MSINGIKRDILFQIKLYIDVLCRSCHKVNLIIIMCLSNRGCCIVMSCLQNQKSIFIANGATCTLIIGLDIISIALL